MSKIKITKETHLMWYELMLRMRKFEERAGMLYGQQKIRGFCHLYIGQEAVAAGIISATTIADPIITAYRDHALAIARGVSCNAAMAELYGKVGGVSGGKGGSMHYFSKEYNFFGGHGIVGAQIGIGAGIAFAEKYKETKNVCITMFGDGAARQGILHETFNMAMTWKLPVVFICENNKYAMGTSVERTSNVHDLEKLALSYNMPHLAVDGMDCEAMHNAVYKAAENARKGAGPTLIEAKTYRYKGHSMSDPQKYRTKEEVEKFKNQDPIDDIAEIIRKNKWADEKWFDSIAENVKNEIEECVRFSEESPYPQAPEELYNHNYVQSDYPFLME